MKDPGNAILSAYYNVLNGNITYNGKNVPVYKSDPIGTLPDNYIVLTNIIEGQSNNNQKFSNDMSIDIDIITTQYKTITNTIADNISNQIVNLITPTTSSFTLTDTDFQFIVVRRERATYLNELDGDYHIIRKILTFNQILIEK